MQKEKILQLVTELEDECKKSLSMLPFALPPMSIFIRNILKLCEKIRGILSE